MTTIAPAIDIDGIAHVRSSIDDVLDYTVDWTDVLAVGETISTSAWTAANGIAKGSAGIGGSKCYVFAGPASAVGSYALKNAIVTSAGRTYERTIVVDAVEKLS